MMHLRQATQNDTFLLAQLNRQLIIAEGSDNPMDEAQRATRMLGFLASNYHAWLFCVADAVVGYALVDMGCDPVYLRHFMIAESYRRHGYGRQAFGLLHHQLDAIPLALDVLQTNPNGLAFWQALGFAIRSSNLRISGKIA
jgi:GNAT superfamily N-acetyltransferase